VPQIILPLGGKKSHWASFLATSYNAKRGYEFMPWTLVHKSDVADISESGEGGDEFKGL